MASSNDSDYKQQSTKLVSDLDLTEELSSNDLNKLLNEVSTKINVPLDILLKFTDDKKRELIKESLKKRETKLPEYYVKKLKHYMENMSLKRRTFRLIGLKIIATNKSTKLFKNLEIALRTNQIDWVETFLDAPLNGLDLIVNYLKNSLDSMQQLDSNLDSVSNHSLKNLLTRNFSTTDNKVHDHLDECIIRCLRAIMNSEHGLRMIIDHKEAIKYLVLSLKYPELKTKSLVLDLLGIICRVDNNGHSIVLKAFDNFKHANKESYRFETLMNYFYHNKESNDFTVTCLHFINIMVNSVQNKNFRIHLQYEFTQLGLDNLLAKQLDDTNDTTSLLQVQIQSYLDNHIDVEQLLNEADVRNETILELEKIQDELLIEKELFIKAQDDALNKISELQNESYQIKSHLDQIVKEKEALIKDMNKHKTIVLPELRDSAIIPSLPQTLLPTLPPPPPPPPPPSCESSTRKKIETKYQLPKLNWIALKPQEIKDTVFCELNDEKYLKLIDFETFEELFKLENKFSLIKKETNLIKKKNSTETLLDPKRQCNLAISSRKIEMNIHELVNAINNLDLTSLSIEKVGILQCITPTEQELKSFQSYIESGKLMTNLSEEDQFLIALSQIERLSQKLSIMSFISEFSNSFKNLLPQINAVRSASLSIKQSKKLKKLLEIVLTFGNYMNSSKRGLAYGFKLQSLESLIEIKTHDKQQTLLNYIVQTVADKFPDLINFQNELTFIDKAALVSIENVQFDMNELEEGMRNTRKEYQIRLHLNTEIQYLNDFLTKFEPQFIELTNKYKQFQEQFNECVKYFGETSKSQSPISFFSIFVKFMKAFNQAKLENEQRITIKEIRDNNALNQNDSLLSLSEPVLKEIKRISAEVNEINLFRLKVKSKNNIEELINEEKNQGFVTPDAERRKRFSFLRPISIYSNN